MKKLLIILWLFFTFAGAYSFANEEIPPTCQTWYDGCNTCTAMDNGSYACTKMACFVQNPPYCKMYKDGTPWTAPDGAVATPDTNSAEDEVVMCPMIYAPVCGTNNQTYGNSCQAGAEKAEIKYEGECLSKSLEQKIEKTFTEALDDIMSRARFSSKDAQLSFVQNIVDRALEMRATTTSATLYSVLSYVSEVVADYKNTLAAN